MAQLKRAEDGHLYILAGPSQGTWQLHPSALRWLKAQKCSLPSYAESITLEGWMYRYLRDHDHLYIHNIPYEHHEVTIDPSEASKRTPEGLSLFLRVHKQQKAPWTLMIAVSELTKHDKAWNELRMLGAVSVLVIGSKCSFIPLRQLAHTLHLVTVAPQAFPYRLLWQDRQQRQQESSYLSHTPGLIENWQGNVFIPWTENDDLWRRCLPFSTHPFSGTLLWLAKADYLPEWPGHASRIGSPSETNWQLWQLRTEPDAALPWKSIEQWFSYRDITIMRPYQRVSVLSPFSARSHDNTYLCTTNHTLFVQTTPALQPIEGITKNAYLSVASVHSSSQTVLASSYPVSAERIHYFRLHTSQSGQYRVHLQGDRYTQPLQLHIKPLPTSCPQWLHGLDCTVSSPRRQYTFHTFTPERDDTQPDNNALDGFTLDELPELQWTYKPVSLPLLVSWYTTTAQESTSRTYLGPLSSAEALTTYWREHLWPTIATSTEASITVDAGSFGLIELSLMLPSTIQDKQLWLHDERITAQFIWYSHILARKQHRQQVTVPASLRQELTQLRAQVTAHSSLYTALEYLARTATMPSWLLVRVQFSIKQCLQNNNRDVNAR